MNDPDRSVTDTQLGELDSLSWVRGYERTRR
jgi:hypothetical protein